jgi:hypothetical protein
MALLIAVTGQLMLLTIPYEISGDEPFAWTLWKWCSGNSIPNFFLESGLTSPQGIAIQNNTDGEGLSPVLFW